MDDQNKNLILAMVLSSLVLVVWMIFFAPEPVEAPGSRPSDASAPVTEDSQTTIPAAETGTEAVAPQESAVASPEAERVPIQTPNVQGSISLAGGRIDQLSLHHYHVTREPSADEVSLFAPVGSERPYHAVFGWVPGGTLGADDVPATDTIWSLESGTALAPGTPLTLRWDSPAGLVFRRQIEVDDRFLFTVTQTVANPTGQPVRLAPYGLVERIGEPQDLSGFFILHEGAIRRSDGQLDEIDYADMPDLSYDDRWGPSADVVQVESGGWVGFTDHYWMTALIPEQGIPFASVVQYRPAANAYRAAARMPTVTVQPDGSASATTRLFAGAKEWETIRDYEAGRRIAGFGDSLAYFMGFGGEARIEGFIDSIDWGWFYFLTKPIFFALHELNVVIGNMGWAIICLTLLIKALLFPLARKSYVSMARMKELQPEMQKLKERAGDDRQKLQQEMMALYKKEKVNPAAGCLPILLQIPIFFSLYKVIFVTIELRHAPWFGPFQDLSAPDPTSIMNLFGILPFAAPGPDTILSLVFIGILPIFLGVSMWMQQKLNPAPTDPTQQMIFAWMPWIFMFMLGSFASGLVIYWIANNVITFAQQYVIMRGHGYRPDIWGNIRGKTRPDGPSETGSDDAPEAGTNAGDPEDEPSAKPAHKPARKRSRRKKPRRKR